MIDEDCVNFFLGGDGLNSSRNLDVLVSATLLLRANGAGAVSNRVSADSLDSPYRCTGLGVSSLSVGNELERLGLLRSEAEMLKGRFSVPVRGKVTMDPP